MRFHRSLGSFRVIYVVPVFLLSPAYSDILTQLSSQQIQALSQALKLPIEVYQANAPVLRIGEDYDDRPLLLS